MVQCVKERPGQVGVAGVVVAAGGVGVLASSGGDGLADRHQRLGHVGPAGVEFEPALVDHVVGLEYQAGFDFRPDVVGMLQLALKLSPIPDSY